MKLFKNILVYQPADQGVTASLRIAARLSHQGAHVTVVDVYEEQDGWWHDLFGSESAIPKDDPEQRQCWLDELLGEVHFDDHVKVKTLTGRPIDRLISEANAGAHDLLIKDAESGSKNLFFGSLDLRLLRLAPSAVWIADPSGPAKPRRILASIDPQADDAEMQMNEQVIRMASLLARQNDAELYVIGAWYTPEAAFEHRGEPYEKYLQAKKHVFRNAWESMEHVINTSLLQIPSDHVFFEEGLASNAIAGAVLEVQPDLLVMGSVTRQGTPGLWIGNTTEEVSRQVECSVLTIKPKDFEFLLPSQSRAH